MAMHVLRQDRIELLFSGTLRRAADYRMEDGSGVVLGQIAERVTRKRLGALGRFEPVRPHGYRVTSVSNGTIATSSSEGAWSAVRGQVSDPDGIRLARVFRAPGAALFPVSIEGGGTLSGVQTIRRSRDRYAAQFVDRMGEQIAEIEATGSNEHGWRHQFLSYRVTFSGTANESQRMVVLGVFPILHMTYVVPRG